MEASCARDEVGGGKTVQSVKLRKEWAEALEEFAHRPNPRQRVFTSEEDAFITAGRKVSMPWRTIAQKIGCSLETVKRRIRELG